MIDLSNLGPVLVANRGECACRIFRTLKKLGIRSVAVYSETDAGSLHVRLADEAICIGPARAVDSYLNIDNVIAAAKTTGARSVHPGFGFLSENAEFAMACKRNGLIFIGPSPESIALMGDKLKAKAAVSSAGVSVIPGSGEAQSDVDLITAAASLEYPLMIKPTAGGGGKGMQIVTEQSELELAIKKARREAKSAFGDDAVFLERYITNPRHIEIQVIADQHGNVTHLGERECSLQRRHQKIIEESPSPYLNNANRIRMAEQAVQAARSCNYVGLGTVEFVVSGNNPDDAYFIEMNTRLQVEHPVTEMVYGIDLVEQQIRIAAGEVMPWSEFEISPNGHAVEVRVYAEDPARDFLPAPGLLHEVNIASSLAVRVDTGVESGDFVNSEYDPMIMKIIAHGPSRSDALAALSNCLSNSWILGTCNNLGFLNRLVSHDLIVRGELDTGLVDRLLVEGLGVNPNIDKSLALGALAIVESSQVPDDPWAELTAFRNGPDSSIKLDVAVDAQPHSVIIEMADDLRVNVNGVDVDLPSSAAVNVIGDEFWVSINGDSTAITKVVHRGSKRRGSAASDWDVCSPMPGRVVAININVGDPVKSGQVVAVVEAMKTEYSLVAPNDGVVSEIDFSAGDQVLLGARLVAIAPNGTIEGEKQ